MTGLPKDHLAAAEGHLAQAEGKMSKMSAGIEHQLLLAEVRALLGIADQLASLVRMIDKEEGKL